MKPHPQLVPARSKRPLFRHRHFARTY